MPNRVMHFDLNSKVFGFRLLPGPVWTEADGIHRPAVAVQDLGLAGRLLIHDPFKHVIRLLLYETEI